MRSGLIHRNLRQKNPAAPRILQHKTVTAHLYQLRVGAHAKLVQHRNIKIDAGPFREAQRRKAHVAKGRRLRHVPYGGVERLSPNDIAYAAPQIAADMQGHKSPKCTVQWAVWRKFLCWRLGYVGAALARKASFYGHARLN